MSKRVCLAVGGTAGHIYPSLELEKLLLAKQEIFFAGVNLESNPHFFHETKNYKSVSGANFSKGIIVGLFKIARGLKESLQFLKKNNIQAVIGFGSFHSLPILLAALYLRLDIYLYESNLFAGRVNRFFSRFAKKSFVVFEETKNLLGDKQCVGFTLSSVKKSVRSNSLYKKYALDPGKKTVLFFGGSLGADVINRLSLDLAKHISKDVQFIHLVGKNKATQEIENLYKESSITHFVTDFQTNMHELYCLSDIAITRSGANTIAEQIQYAIASIHIPFEKAVQNHQEFNAKFMQDQMKGSIMFLENAIDEKKILACIEDPVWHKNMKENLLKANERFCSMNLEL